MTANRNLLDSTPKILLADDDKDDCLLFNEALQELQLASHLSVVHDGEQLMRVLPEYKNKLPDVIFLDLNMPRKNGFTSLQEIKSNEKLKSIPVIIISTSYDQKIADVLYKNGALFYICKPTDFSELKKVIQLSMQLVLGKCSQPPKEKFVLSNLKSVLV